jgi:predicted Zn-dependent protease
MRKLIIAVVLLALCVAGVWFFRPAYRHWQQGRFVTAAQMAMAADDLKGAALSARQALDVNPSNLNASRVMATLTERLHHPASVGWWQKVVTLQPDAVSNRLDLARCAVTFGDFPKAVQALQGIPASNRNTPTFHQIAGMVSVGMRDLTMAEAHFAEAARLEPTNATLEFNLDVIRLQARNTSVVAQAIQSLEKLRSDPTHGQDALRHLAMAATHQNQSALAIELTRQLIADPKCTMDDRLLHLGALKDALDPQFTNYLATVETSVSTNAAQINVLAGWLIVHNMPEEAARWLDGLPATIKSEQPVTLARADAYVALNDWPKMQTALEEQKWDDIDFLRLAMLSRACREQNQDFASQKEWLAAVQSCSDRPRALAALASMAGRWGWAKEREDLLWTVINKFPSERWALQSLNETYTSTGNTRGLQKVFSLLVSYNPQDAVAMNNAAAVSLLLNMQIARSAEMAREAYTLYPSNASFASTMAYGLHLQGRTAEGITVLETLKPAQLEQPSIALYYGVLLSALEPPDKEKVKKFLDIAAKGRLLPEEKILLREARRGL